MRAWMRSRSVWASAAEVGSSAQTRTGRLRRARAMATRCFSPPEILTARSPRRASRGMAPSFVRATTASRSSSDASRSPYRTFQRAVSSKSWGACGTKPRAARRLASST
mmetsp:Transcript_3321/g.10300  ORF Transcript_3321/g.10300 Transcript_3321/m.10300 type:complete len:109 (+) Transcript_3321:605-931(+)